MSGARSISVEVHGEAAVAYLSGLKERLHSNLLRIVTELSVRLQSMVKGKLSGPVLHTRTGTLRRSINRVVIDEDARIVAQVGTNVGYAAVHEFGFDGVVNVRAYVRRRYAPSQPTLQGRSHEGIRTWALKRGEVAGETTVRAHARHMHMPERSYLRSSLEDMRLDITREIREGAREAMHG